MTKNLRLFYQCSFKDEAFILNRETLTLQYEEPTDPWQQTLFHNPLINKLFNLKLLEFS